MAYSDSDLSISNAAWIDINTLITVNGLPDRIPDEVAVEVSSLVNLFNCPIGSRGPIFEPQYGSMLYHYLQEPPGDETADSIQICLIQAIGRWEPRIDIQYGDTSVTWEPELPGYRIRLAYKLILTGELKDTEFNVALPGV